MPSARHHTPAYPAYVSYVILIEFDWNGLKVSEVDSLENRKFLEESHLNL